MNSHFIQFFTSLLEGFLNISPQLVWMLENNIEFFGGTQHKHKVPVAKRKGGKWVEIKIEAYILGRCCMKNC